MYISSALGSLFLFFFSNSTPAALWIRRMLLYNMTEFADVIRSRPIISVRVESDLFRRRQLFLKEKLCNLIAEWRELLTQLHQLRISPRHKFSNRICVYVCRNHLSIHKLCGSAPGLVHRPKINYVPVRTRAFPISSEKWAQLLSWDAFICSTSCCVQQQQVAWPSIAGQQYDFPLPAPI